MVRESQVQGLHKMVLSLQVDILKYLKEHQKSVILVKILILMLLVIQWYKKVFSVQFNQSA